MKTRDVIYEFGIWSILLIVAASIIGVMFFAAKTAVNFIIN